MYRDILQEARVWNENFPYWIIEWLRNIGLKTTRASAVRFVFLTFEDPYKHNCLGAERVQEDGQGARLVGSLRVGWKRCSRESRHLR